MDFRQIDKWFRDYAGKHMAEVGSRRRAMQMKYGHSRRVAARCRAIALDMGWPEDEVAAAQVLGLLHDVSRFVQLAEYGTLFDARSFDHGERGYMILRSEEMVPSLSPWRTVVLAGVRYHNKRRVPARVGGDRLRFLHLVRDADKSDIVMTLARALRDRRYSDYPESVESLSITRGPSPEVLEAVEAGESVSYTSMKSLADLQLVLLGWIRELHYKVALRRLLREGFFKVMASSLPADRRMQAVLTAVRASATARLEGKV